MWGDGKKVSTTWLMMMIAAIAIRYSNDYVYKDDKEERRRVVEWVDRSSEEDGERDAKGN